MRSRFEFKFWQGLPVWAVAVGLTALTLVLVGAVAMVTTPAGCFVSNRIGIQANASRCPAATAGKPPKTSPSAQVSFVPTPSSAPLPTASARPTPTKAPSPTPHVGPPYQFPTSSALPPYISSSSGPLPYTITLRCRLPLYTGQAGSGGFEVFPERSFIADPKSAVTLPTPSPNATPPPPGYYQQSGLSYNSSYKVWLPVIWNWVSPGGQYYAWPSPDSIYVRDVANQTLTELGEGHAWILLSVGSTGVYATRPNVPGLWFLPYSGAAKQVTATRWWQAVSAGAAYGTDTSAVPQGASNVIIQLDLTSGSTKSFFEARGAQSQVVGFDANGHPLIQTNSNFGSHMWLVTGVGQATIIAQLGQLFSPNGPPLADSHGIWFGGYQSLYLFIPNTGLFSLGGIGGQLAGACD